MSQKSTKRSRKQTIEEEEDNEFKTPPTKSGNGEANLPPSDTVKTDLNGTENEKKGNNESDNERMTTRSRSNTPQQKRVTRKSIEANGSNELNESQSNSVVITSSTTTTTTEIIATTNENGVNVEEKLIEKEVDTVIETDTVEADPLADEPDPELLFDENSDLDSDKGSPVMSRCITRRSQTRNIPTPKTPKLIDENDTEKKNSSNDLLSTEVLGNDLENNANNEINDNNEKKDTNDDVVDNNHEDINNDLQLEDDFLDEPLSPNLSVKAQVGSDSTRLDFTEKNFSLLEHEESSFLSTSKKQSLVETLRGLSGRRSIRPINESYLINLSNPIIRDKSDLNIIYPTRNSVERVSISSKRKRGSESSDDITKRFKIGSPGFIKKLASPLQSIRNPFKSHLRDVPASTPKLTGYKDDNVLIEDENLSRKEEIYERKWCSIM